MAFLPAVFAVASGAISAVGAIASANAQAAAAKYNADIDRRNAIVVDQNRANLMRQTEIDAQAKRRENQRTLGTIRAAYGASGLEMSGSPLDVLEDSALELETDVHRVEYEGRMKGREMAFQAQTYRESAKLRDMEAKAAKRSGFISAAGYLVGGAGQALRVN